MLKTSDGFGICISSIYNAGKEFSQLVFSHVVSKPELAEENEAFYRILQMSCKAFSFRQAAGINWLIYLLALPVAHCNLLVRMLLLAYCDDLDMPAAFAVFRPW